MMIKGATRGEFDILYFVPTNKTDCHDITEILLKVALNTINQTKPTIQSKASFTSIIR
jgi:hypothetical protein